MGRVRPGLVRGDVWDAEFDPVRGHEQAGWRPALIVSTNRFHQSRSGLAYVAPLTRTDRGTPWQIPVQPPEAGLSAPSFVLCDQVRVFAVERLHRRRGPVSAATMAEVEDRLRILLDL